MSLGVVEKQGLRYALISFVNMGLGVLNNLFIYPKFLLLYGFFQSINAIATLISPLGQYGLSVVLMKYHHELFGARKNQLFTFALYWLLFSSLFLFVLYLLGLDAFVSFTRPYFPHIEFILNYRWLIYIVMILINVILTLTAIAAIFKDVATPHLVNKLLGMKILVPIAIVAAGTYSMTPKRTVLYGYTVILTLIVMTLLSIFNRRKQLSFQRVSLDSKFRDVFSFASFGILDKTSSNLAFCIDIVMVKLLLGDVSTGVYAIFNFLGNVLRIPITSIDAIYNPIISKLWNDKKLNEIQDKYSKASITLFTLTLGLFLLIDLSINDLLVIMNNEANSVGRYVFLFIGLGILVDSMTMLNSHILIYSNSYRWNLYFTLISAVLNVFLTYFFVKYLFEVPYKAAGAALSTAISLMLFNLVKTAYIYYKYRLHPFHKNHLLLILLAIFIYVFISVLPLEFNAFVNMILRSIVIVVLFGVPVYYFKISYDVNNLINNFLKIKVF